MDRQRFDWIWAVVFTSIAIIYLYVADDRDGSMSIFAVAWLPRIETVLNSSKRITKEMESDYK